MSIRFDDRVVVIGREVAWVKAELANTGQALESRLFVNSWPYRKYFEL